MKRAQFFRPMNIRPPQSARPPNNGYTQNLTMPYRLGGSKGGVYVNNNGRCPGFMFFVGILIQQSQYKQGLACSKK